MSREDDKRAQSEQPSYRIHRGGRRGRSGADEGSPESWLDSGERPYRTYRAAPVSLRSRLRGEDDIALPSRLDEPPRPRRRRLRGPLTWKRALVYAVGLIAAWLLLSLVLFVASASKHQGEIPSSAQAQLASGSNMLTSSDTVLILGTDQRPRTGANSKEPGSNYNDLGSRSDTIMLWRIGGGVSRRLSIPRDTAADVPGLGMNKINAAYAIGGPALALKTVKRFTGLEVNHLIVINLGNFPKFIDDVGGVTVKTNRVCSSISGGVANGGFTLNLGPGVHHLDGSQAMILARTRENSCNPAENDLTRAARQQAILNGIKSQLLSFHTFLHLPWVATDAPSVLRTDMGGFTLLSMFGAAELGGSAPVDVLKPSGSEALPGGGDALVASPGAVHRAVQKLLTG